MAFEDEAPVPGARRPDDRSVHPSGLTYGSWWQRVGAEILDQIFVTLPLGIALAVLDVPRTMASIVLGVAVFAYSWTLDSEPGGQTWGKRISHIRVVGDETGAPISRSQGAARAGLVAGLALLGNLTVGDAGSASFTLNILGTLDLLWPLWDRKRQTWHDKVARSVVVRSAD